MGHLVRISRRRRHITELADDGEYGQVQATGDMIEIGLGVDFLTNAAYRLRVTGAEWIDLRERVEDALQQQ